jgi:hypothetical protein
VDAPAGSPAVAIPVKEDPAFRLAKILQNFSKISLYFYVPSRAKRQIWGYELQQYLECGELVIFISHYARV